MTGFDSERVARKARPDTVYEYNRYKPLQKPSVRWGKYRRAIVFPTTLHDQIEAEAIKRGWSFGRMVRFLCDASIEGIE